MTQKLTKELLLGFEENPVWIPYTFSNRVPQALIWSGDASVVAFQSSEIGNVIAMGRVDQIDDEVKGKIWVLDGEKDLSMMMFDDVIVVGLRGVVSFYTKESSVGNRVTQ
jgi:hypothetical protein